MRESNLMAAACLLALAACGSGGSQAPGQAAGAPDEATVRQVVEASYGGNGHDLSSGADTSSQWNSVDIAPAKTMDLGEAAADHVPPNIPLYPVRVAYRRTSSSGQSHMTRDIVAHYYFYRDEFGKWTMTGFASPEDKFDLMP